MKNKILLVLSLLFIVSYSYSQCSIIGTASPQIVPCGDSSVLSAIGTSNSLVFGEDFNSGAPVGWQFTQTVTIANSTCGVPSPDGSNFMWMGSAASFPRSMTTVPLDLSCGGDICFEMRYAVQGGSAPCEGPDLPTEGVSLEYSLNNITWTQINYWPPTNQGMSSSPMTQWAQYCESIPLAAQTTGTYIRWLQADASNSQYDHWGLDNIQINATSCGNYQITWLHDNYTLPMGTLNGSNPTPVYPTQNSQYTVMMTNGIDTCYDVVDVNIDAPTVTVNDTVICEGEYAQLTAVASMNGGTYTWSPGNQTGNSILVNPSSTTDYTVTYNSICPSTNAISTVTVNPAPTVTVPDYTICEGDVVSITATPDQMGSTPTGGTYTWNNGMTGQTIQVNPQSPTNYFVTYNLGGCLPAVNGGFVDFSFSNSSFTVSDDVFYNLSQEIVFTNNSSGASTYLWNFGDSISSTQENTTHLFQNTTNGYTVTLISYTDIGCPDTSMLFIPYENGLVFWIPNTFTPDEDPFNQTFKPVFVSGYDPNEFTMEIYNRWGDLIFKTHNDRVGWDGSFGMNGTNAPDGVYTYYITYKIPEVDERKVVKGHINLLR